MCGLSLRHKNLVILPCKDTVHDTTIEHAAQSHSFEKCPASHYLQQGKVGIAYLCFNIVESESCKWLQAAQRKVHLRFSQKKNFQCNMKPA